MPYNPTNATNYLSFEWLGFYYQIINIIDFFRFKLHVLCKLQNANVFLFSNKTF